MRELATQIDAAYQKFNQRSDVEVADEHDGTTQLPPNGMQVHDEYTLYAHFLYLKKLLPNHGKLRFFLDQDSPIRAACLAAFHQEIKNRTVDAFYVRINKSMTVNEKKKAKQHAQEELEAIRDTNPGLTDQMICNLLAQEQVAGMSPHGKWNDLWFMHPLPDMTEPEKAICHLTDMGDYSVEHRANLYLKAALKSTDSYFMQLRRMVSLIERPTSTASANQRRWHGYHAYNPNVIVKLLTIYRAYYNFVKVSDKHGTTPAQRLGLARAPADINSILYF
ncbi:MAG: hypothetical protein N0E42_12130 [Candidatus Thiodiazotropha endolucinida]|nr:hypothetical protein [Candidatus Thiodiazotropha taylori]MCW4225219.1 hypothetical protein [Candidatus Thiodiazotropha endolucinida]MCW4304196.1 hypothetical protein [Candidatus Thiodiazotropha taylori]